MQEIEVFRTNVTCRRVAAGLLRQLLARYPAWGITFDLTDCDRVLRVQTPGCPIDSATIIHVLQASGYLCEPLPE
ncbi:hypothetical protein BXP70_16380 [Hymenobacter crusticola]|uniref:HMA domain-containing protein n=2 Tax=Hymenobacter crusticola TaxID=1770526 RepID=A0A243WBJ3_9BACT|nr:hypothetical protein BXP70_16380 [Hymenobacter crusticola]